jgi:transcriptional regulator with XRE-family HTH domain
MGGMVGDEWGAHLGTVGAFIREQRRLVKLSQRQLAKASGLSDTYLSQLERGMHEPSLRALRAIARGLNVSADQLISLTGALEADLGGEDDDPDHGSSPDGGAARATPEVAIRQDPRLTEAQKTALLAVLGSYLESNAADSADPVPGTTPGSAGGAPRRGRGSR